MTGLGILKAFDFAGKEIWSRDIQKGYGLRPELGYGSSLVLLQDSPLRSGLSWDEDDEHRM